MIFDDALFLLITTGLVLCGAYFRAEFRQWRKGHAREAANREFHGERQSRRESDDRPTIPDSMPLSAAILPFPPPSQPGGAEAQESTAADSQAAECAARNHGRKHACGSSR
ncbi:MAG: hypothetical protein QOD56_2564 [Gammaproteobacteria bacterium]|jgi:hypothetical protein|nr:hypothetical protein [Gammaproteobacteria bacterium]